MGNKASSSSSALDLSSPSLPNGRDVDGDQACCEEARDEEATNREEEPVSDESLGGSGAGGHVEGGGRGASGEDSEGPPGPKRRKEAVGIGDDAQPPAKQVDDLHAALDLDLPSLELRARCDHVSHSCMAATGPCTSSGCLSPPPVRLEPVSFQLLLHCDVEKTTQLKTLEVVHFPETTLSLKQAIEDKMSIPACCQRLQLENIPLRDSDSLRMCHLRVGDTISVHFDCEADVDSILEVIAAMKLMIPYIDSIQPQLCAQAAHLLDAELRECIKASLVEDLTVKYFFPCSADRSKANRLFFVHRGGLETMHHLHMTLLRHPWQNLPIQLQYLEHAILRTLWNVTAAFAVRSFVLRMPTIAAASQSLLRVKVHPDKLIEAPCPQRDVVLLYGGRLELNRIVSEVIYKATGILCK